MKRLLAIVLCLALVLTGCSVSKKEKTDDVSKDEGQITEVEKIKDGESEKSDGESQIEEFIGLDDPNLLTYVENNVYDNLIEGLDSEDFFVENVEAVYLSQEYIDELEFNSESNIYFGYTLEEVENVFGGQRYVFTLGEDGQTIVKELEEIQDDTYEQIIKDVAIGTGVILFCVTVSAATTVAAPAVSLIFATAATNAATYAISSAAIGFVTAAIVKGYQTQDFEQAMKAGALSAAEGFKWGAILGAVKGAASETIALKGATLNGLSMNEAAIIQRESKWPIDAIKSIHSIEEYNIYKSASVVPTQLPNGSWALTRQIDWTLVDDMGRTNVERVMANLAPIDSSGMPYELHHIGMKAESPLAILTNAEHHAKENYKVLHYSDVGKDITEVEWQAQKKAFWKAILKIQQGIE